MLIGSCWYRSQQTYKGISDTCAVHSVQSKLTLLSTGRLTLAVYHYLLLCLHCVYFFLKIHVYGFTILSLCPSHQLVNQLAGCPEIWYGLYSNETIYFSAIDMEECSGITYTEVCVKLELVGQIQSLRLLRFIS